MSLICESWRNFGQSELWNEEERTGLLASQWELRVPRASLFLAKSGRCAGEPMCVMSSSEQP